MTQACDGVVVVARIAQQQHGGLRADVLAVALPEHLERVAVVAVPVDPHHVGLGVDPVDGVGDVFLAAEVVGDLVDAVDEHERAHLRELALDGVHEHQREPGERRHRAGDVGDDHQLGLGRTRVLELRLGRHAAVAEAVAHRVAEVERALATVATLAGQAGGELAGERLQRLLQVLHLVARGVHELDVFGQRLAQRLGHGLGTAVGDEAATDLGLDLLLELLDAIVVLVALEPLLERGELAADLLACSPP